MLCGGQTWAQVLQPLCVLCEGLVDFSMVDTSGLELGDVLGGFCFPIILGAEHTSLAPDGGPTEYQPGWPRLVSIHKRTWTSIIEWGIGTYVCFEH